MARAFTRLLPAGVLALTAAGPATADGILYRVDPSFATLAFTVDNLGGLFSTRGRFTRFEGQLLLDLDAPEAGRVEVTAEAASVETGWAVADEMLRSADYFDPPNHPTLRYVSRRVEVLGPGRVIVHGDLTLRGVTLPQAFEARLEGQRLDLAQGPSSQGPIADFTVTGRVLRDAYGMTADHPLVSGTVAVTIRAHIRLTPGPAVAD